MNPLNSIEVQRLYSLCAECNEIAKKDGIELRVVEIKETYYFFPTVDDALVGVSPIVRVLPRLGSIPSHHHQNYRRRM